MNKEQELISMVDNLEKAYDPSSPNYKFKYVFYNKVDGQFFKPADFPDALWYTSLRKDTSLMPVLLKGPEIDKRRKDQVETAKKLNSSFAHLHNKIEELRNKSDKIRYRLYSILEIYRKAYVSIYNNYRSKVSTCNLVEEIDKLNVEMKSEQYTIIDKKKEIVEYLQDIRNTLQKLLSKLNEEIYEFEKRKFIINNINKI